MPAEDKAGGSMVIGKSEPCITASCELLRNRGDSNYRLQRFPKGPDEYPLDAVDAPHERIWCVPQSPLSCCAIKNNPNRRFSRSFPPTMEAPRRLMGALTVLNTSF